MKVAPSILAADFLNLEKDLERLNNSTCDYIHLDIMDGHFVKGITFGFDLVAKIKEKSTKKLDVHLMHSNPTHLIEELVNLKVDIITIHAEVLNNVKLDYLLKLCKEANIKFGIAFCPETAIKYFKPEIEQVDFILLMSVHPGKGGQKFMPEILKKVEEVRNINKNVIISIDGGITEKTISLVKETSIDIVVAGTYVFTGDLQSNVKTLQMG